MNSFPDRKGQGKKWEKAYSLPDMHRKETTATQLPKNKNKYHPMKFETKHHPYHNIQSQQMYGIFAQNDVKLIKILHKI